MQTGLVLLKPGGRAAGWMQGTCPLLVRPFGWNLDFPAFRGIDRVLGQGAEAIMTMHAPRGHALERESVLMKIAAHLTRPPLLDVND